MNLYIVQAEEGSGIPGTPEVFIDEQLARKAYEDAWREAWSSELDELEVAEIMAGDYDAEWPEDGGVRMWVVEAPDGLELTPGPCPSCGDSIDDHQWHNDITHTYGG